MLIKNNKNHETQVIEILNDIFDNTIKKNASDIHFEQSRDTLKVRLRVDGMLAVYKTFDKNLANQIISRLKVLANLDIAEKRLPQDGSIKLNNLVEFRMSTCPTIFGEKVALRLLKVASNAFKLQDLGMEPWQEQILLQTIKKPQGLILITGPTGSGKTSSLYATLNELNNSILNIVTIEDPVEITLPSINQVNINPKIGINFANLLKTLLRHDPDVIMVGEIRDQETANIAIKAAQTGHLILSTLHTNSAKETIARLELLGVTNYEFLSTINLIINQRLIRKLCNVCKLAQDVSIKILEKYRFFSSYPHSYPHDAASMHNNTFKIFKPRSCSSCNNGYKGRIGVFEFLSKQQLQMALRKYKSASTNYPNKQRNRQYTKQHKITENGKNNYSLREAILGKIQNGITSLEELQRVL